MSSAVCSRCKRPVAKPVIVDGRGYGSTCALKVKPMDLLTQEERDRVRFTEHRRRPRHDERQLVIAEVLP